MARAERHPLRDLQESLCSRAVSNVHYTPLHGLGGARNAAIHIRKRNARPRHAVARRRTLHRRADARDTRHARALGLHFLGGRSAPGRLASTFRQTCCQLGRRTPLLARRAAPRRRASISCRTHSQPAAGPPFLAGHAPGRALGCHFCQKRCRDAVPLPFFARHAAATTRPCHFLSDTLPRPRGPAIFCQTRCQRDRGVAFRAVHVARTRHLAPPGAGHAVSARCQPA
jgi:hypothetical protein